MLNNPTRSTGMDLFNVGLLLVVTGVALLALGHFEKARRRAHLRGIQGDHSSRPDQTPTVIWWNEGDAQPPAIRIPQRPSHPAADLTPLGSATTVKG
jgi:hypothetical protein